MADVFVSYAKEDRTLAERVVCGLRNLGFTVWWDPDIRNEHWDRAIEQQIAEARSVVVLWTPASVNSEWVREEANYAKGNGKLIQAKCGPITAPLGFTRIQHADLSISATGEIHAGWDELVSWVSEMVGSAPDIRKALGHFRRHFMDTTGGGVEAYSSIELHTPVEELLDEEFASAEQFADLAWSFCAESGACGDADDWLLDELIELYNEHAPSISVGHLVELVRERTAKEKAEAERTGKVIDDIFGIGKE